ncbi:MAG: Rho termination factor N-terminal domain-containing protein [Methanomicrobiales archaeon]|nr:Rho termination factor N-terminal domain-containing protein [Methanomicrobiales archaeon]MDI6875259.1 Rho termination factor N-terminal domain-containing protein [Methanomicrobiales archaeon]
MATEKHTGSAREHIHEARQEWQRGAPAERFQGGREREEGGPTPAQQRARRENIEKAQEARRYENRTKRDLYERAKELDISGRSKMSKHELIAALRERR